MSKLTLSIKTFDDGHMEIENECCDECFNKELRHLYEFIGGLLSNHQGMSPSDIIEWSEDKPH